jgi:cytochrome c
MNLYTAYQNQIREVSMRKGLCIAVFMVMAIFCAVHVLHAATIEDAKTMVAKVVEFWKANGKDKTIAEVNKGPNGQFYIKDGDVFPFIEDMKGVLLAHGGNPKIVGINFYETKDPSGKFFVKEQVEIAKTKGSGVFEYVWTHPQTKKVAPKIGYLRKVDDTIIAVGVFK